MTTWRMFGSRRKAGADKYTPYLDRWDWRMLHRVHEFVRPLFVDDIDRNEDYVCGRCGRPVLTRLVFCSSECSELVEEEHKSDHE